MSPPLSLSLHPGTRGPGTLHTTLSQHCECDLMYVTVHVSFYQRTLSSLSPWRGKGKEKEEDGWSCTALMAGVNGLDL